MHIDRWHYPSVTFFLLLFAPLYALGEKQVALSIHDIESTTFSAKGISAVLQGNNLSRLEIKIAELQLYGKAFRNASLRCPRLDLDATRIHCAQGSLQLQENIPISFNYTSTDKSFSLRLNPAHGEIWSVAGSLSPSGLHAAMNLQNAQLSRLATWLPDGAPKVGSGIAQGNITLAADSAVVLDLTVSGLGFSDTTGLHAGEKVSGQVQLQAGKKNNILQWKGRVDWGNGEIFWQPLYLTGGFALEAAGTLSADTIQIDNAQLNATNIGQVDFNASWDRDNNKLDRVRLSSSALSMAALYERILKPFLQGGKYSDMRTAGSAQLSLDYNEQAIQSLKLNLKDLSLEDLKNRRFALFGVNASIPWDKIARRHADISVEGGELLRIPFGKFHVPLEMQGLDFEIGQLQIPLLDGKLSLNDFVAKKTARDWTWQFRGGLTPISVNQLTQSLGLPQMYGKLSAVIPKVSYAQSTLKIDGALLFNIFDGTVTAKNLELLDPLGSAPHLTSNLEMRNLDLNLLTRTFSFGSVTGKIDAQLDNVELINWEPVKFDAKIVSSPGDYPKRISQTAVGNISALGGASASAAIQRTFLRFLKTFGYSKIGLSCHLRNGVCEMGGIEPVAGNGFLIVKGGGVPEINVIGYNRRVNWHELLNRVKNITKGEIKPVIK